MTKLAKFAALATIIGTLFTIYVYYKDGKTIPIVSGLKENLKEARTKETELIEDKEKNYCELLIKEFDLLPLAEITELKVRHTAAREIPSSTNRSDALFDLVKICIKNQQFDYASEVARDIPSSTTRSEAYRAIAVLLAYNGKFENAITAAREIPSSTTRSLALKQISTIKKNPRLLEQNGSDLPNRQIQPAQKPSG
jgi:hypothetical protein